jgi:hypothetical protein
MRSPWKILLRTTAVASAVLAAFTYLVFDSFPAIQRSAEISPASIGRAKRIVEQNDPRKLKPGARRTILIGKGDLDLAANYLARQYAAGGARVELKRGAALIDASLRMPLPIPAYLNVHAELTESVSLPRIRALRLGHLPIPGRLAHWITPRLLQLAVPEGDVEAFASAIQKISMRDDRIALTYTWRADLPMKMRAFLLPDEERERLRLYQERLAAVSESLQTSNPSLLELLAPLFTLAGEPSRRGDAVAENRAVILLLALYVTDREIEAVVPEAKSWPRPRKHTVLLNGRADLAKHFIVSSALAAKAGGPLSDAVGLYKELADAREGSGFSFNDLAADRAGSRFGEYAADSATAELLQQRLREGIAQRDVIPVTEDLPEFLSEREFAGRFGTVDAPAYKQVIAEIERRIAALALYR